MKRLFLGAKHRRARLVNVTKDAPIYYMPVEFESGVEASADPSQGIEVETFVPYRLEVFGERWVVYVLLGASAEEELVYHFGTFFGDAVTP